MVHTFDGEIDADGRDADGVTSGTRVLAKVRRRDVTDVQHG